MAASNVVPRTEFFTVQQKDDAFIQQWKKITKEEIDFDQFSKEDEITYYNCTNKSAVRYEYDIRFNFRLDYDQKIKRCDRHNLDIIRDNIFNEESERIFPIVVSHIYGHRKTNLEGLPLISHRKMKIMEGLTTRNKINMKPSKKTPKIHGYPQLS